MQTVMRARKPEQTTGSKQVSEEKFMKLSEKWPVVAESVARALRSVIDFHKTRGAMLRSIVRDGRKEK
jgi:hypothetical protein